MCRLAAQLKVYKALLEQLGLDVLEGPTHKDTRVAYLEAEAEIKLAEAELQRTKGRDVRYGSVVQLWHVSTATFLSTSRTTHGSGQLVILDRNAGESGWFRVMPRLRVHNEGQLVRRGDPVLLSSLDTGQLLLLDGGTLVTVENTTSAMDDVNSDFRIRLYRSVFDTAERVINGGTPCTFLHKEFDAFLGRRRRESDVDRSNAGTVRMVPSTSKSKKHDEVLLHTIWQVSAAGSKLPAASRRSTHTLFLLHTPSTRSLPSHPLRPPPALSSTGDERGGA